MSAIWCEGCQDHFERDHYVVDGAHGRTAEFGYLGELFAKADVSDRYRAALENIASGPSAREAMLTAREALNPPPAGPGDGRKTWPCGCPTGGGTTHRVTCPGLVEDVGGNVDVPGHGLVYLGPDAEPDDPRIDRAEDDRRDPDADDAPRGWEP